MLDDKDKLILEYLMHDCRITTTKLAKLAKMTQPSIIYRIKKLEDENYILKYDGLVNFDKLPFNMYILFLKIPNKLKLKFEDWCISNKNLMTLTRHINKYNYSITSLFNNKSLKELNKYLKKNKIEYEIHRVYKTLYMPFSIFDMIPSAQIKPFNEKILKLDRTDGIILDYMMDGGAKDTVKDIASKTNLSIDLITYRLRKLKKYDYFPLLIAHPNTEKFHLNYNIFILKVKNLEMIDVVEKLQKVNKTSILGKLENNTYFATTIITDIENYRKTLNKIYESFDENLIELNDLMIKDAVFLNRLNLKEML